MTDQKCHAECSDGSECQAWAMENGRCRHHGGKSTGPKTEEGKANSAMRGTKHGLRADPVNLLEDLRKNDEEAFAWIQDKFESYLELAPFGRDTAHADQLMQICVREYSIWKASQIQVNDGILTREKKVAGEAVIKVDVENPASKSLDRMERTVVKRLEKLGVMPSPEQMQAEADKTLAAVLSEQD